MLGEENIDQLIASLHNVSYSISGVSFSPQIIREGEDVDRDESIIIYSFIPTSTKVGQGLDNYLGTRDNINYTDYGYGTVNRCYVRAYSINMSGYDGRFITQTWVNKMKSYIYNEWDSLITGGSVDKYTGTPQKLHNTYNIRQFGYEYGFNIIATETWTDEPETGAISPVDVSGIIIESGVQLWVNI